MCPRFAVLCHALQLCTALQAEIEDYKKHSSTAVGRSPGARSIVSPGGVGASSGAAAAAVAELEQQLQSAQQQVSQLQRELDDSKQEADRTMTEMRAQRAEERNTLANAQAELAQVQPYLSTDLCSMQLYQHSQRCYAVASAEIIQTC